MFTPAPSSTTAYPACIAEDGAGQALCYWDAHTMGNGQGTSVVSGDCAPSLMGPITSAVCVKLHAMPSSTATYQGAITEWPAGPDLVAECMDENQGMTQKEREENGFSLLSCFNAQMGE